MNQKQLLMYAAIGSAATVLGVFLPWASVSAGPFSMSASGIDGGDGKIVLILALVAAAVTGLAWKGMSEKIPLPRKTQMLIAGACLVIAGIIMLIDFFDVSGPVSRGIGLYLCTLGSIGGAVCMFLMLKAEGMLPKVDTSGGGGDAPKGDDAPKDD